MKHLHLKRTTIMVMISIVFLAAGYAAAVKEQQPSTEMSPGFPDRQGMPPMAWGMQGEAGEAAQFESNINRMTTVKTRECLLSLQLEKVR